MSGFKPTFHHSQIRVALFEGLRFVLLFLFNFKGLTINISVGKSLAVKLVMSSKASGENKSANRLTIRSWRKRVKEGAPQEVLLKSGVPQKQIRWEDGATGFQDPLF